MRIKIDENHIKEAEQILIKGDKFDKERIDFIKELETCDLLAVPGSGKTTALMAKLYCLSQKLSFGDEAGILVLAHTNAAVNEIESKLKKYCPILFEYPHFIGTIQSFINNFMATPYYTNTNNRKIYIIDPTYSNKEMELKLKTNRCSEINYFKNRNPGIFFNVRFSLNEDGKHFLIDTSTNNSLALPVPRKWIDESTAEDKKKIILSFIEDTKIKTIQNGILSFDDCYFLGEKYLFKYPHIKQQLQHRFKYVFIDEMQDLEKFQLEIIDKIFFTDSSTSVVQRIGDINQAIYKSGKKIKIECDWKTRESQLPTKYEDRYLTGSNRLTKLNAEVVNCFTLDSKNGKFEVIGNKKIGAEDIKPHLILFNAGTKDKLKTKFEEIIKEYKLHEIEEAKHGFKIIGWTAERENEGDGNMCLHTIFGYNKEEKNNKEDFDSLSKYLQLFNQTKNTLEAVRKSILNALIAILRLENCKVKRKFRGKDVERFYTKADMIEYIKEYKKDEFFQNAYESFKEKLFQWSFDLGAKKKAGEVYNSIVAFLNKEFKEWFELSLTASETNSFIGSFTPIDTKQEKKVEEKADQIKIEIATVHSVKGQTHCATMYVETAYKTPVYETLKLKEESRNQSKKKRKLKTIPLYKQKHSCETPTGFQALKMMYVGFSRPTHLLCFAALKENVKGDIAKFENSGWAVKDLTSND